ncbi:M61 family metallopeptidase [Pyrinomonas methylaliphatogenes]|nr:PDZ domain-containing protein [Pyrinomonas methylaliphatogenes]
MIWVLSETMHQHHLSLLVFLLLLLIVSSSARSQGAPRRTPPEISFTVSMPRPYTHLFEVEMRVRLAEPRAQTDLVMPVWTPGSYLIREYARHVQDFSAETPARALAWRKVTKNTWRIDTDGEREFIVRYRVYANELSVRTNELNDRHAFWNNAALLMYIDGYLDAPATLRIIPYGNWRIATGLPQLDGQANVFRAENFDILYDSPVLVSDFHTIEFQARGVPHRIVIDGEGNYDAERIRRDAQRIVEAAIEMMGDVPYRDYTFLLMLAPTGGGGLEHLNSSALIWRRFGFRPEKDYRDFLALMAHEFFHLWNVKRIRPDALGPFDYTRENYTKLLWVAEGLTSYYENILLLRAGLISDRDYLQMLAEAIKNLQSTPGRLVMSVEEASFDAWIKYYRRDENSVNSQVSYYDKGALLGALLDLEIRRRSDGRRSLDDVMRYLYAEFYRKGRNYTPEDFARACELMAGASLAEFFERYVRGRDELPYNNVFEAVGLQLRTKSEDPNKPPKAYLGAQLAQEGERLMVRAVRAGTPAYDQGLNANDQIIALDGKRVDLASFNARLEERRPGEIIRLTLFRADDLRTLEIKLGAEPDDDYRLVPVQSPTEAQRRLYRAWLGAPFPPPLQQKTGE